MDEPAICPMKNLLDYIVIMEKSFKRKSFVFADDKEGRFQTRINNIVNYWRLAAEKVGIEEHKRPRAHSLHGGKANLGRALGFNEEDIVDAMGWKCKESLHTYLR